MSFSLSRKQPLDPGAFGIAREDLPPLDAGPIDLKSWFASEDDPQAVARPLELEIGSGKGTFLVQQATQTPNVNYIGLEYAKAFWRYGADRVRRHELHNVRLVHDEANSFVRNRIADGVLRQVHIYFPDPWPKARHNKRRLIQEPFLRELHRVLEQPAAERPGTGRASFRGVRLATDHADYFEWMNEHVAKVADLFEKLDFASPDSAGEGELVGTNFERKYRREGRPMFGMILRKR